MQKIFTKEFRPGEKWSSVIGKNKYIHFKALGDNANVSVLLYNAKDTSERYNMPDTLKAQYTAHLTKGNDYYRCGEENFKVELVRNNMGKRDLVPCVNLFAKVYVEEDGSMHYVTDHCKKGATVTLRTEMDCIIVISNTPNPLDPSEKYPSVPVTLEVYNAPRTDLTDECVNYREKNYRAFENTWDYLNLRGIG